MIRKNALDLIEPDCFLSISVDKFGYLITEYLYGMTKFNVSGQQKDFYQSLDLDFRSDQMIISVRYELTTTFPFVFLKQNQPDALGYNLEALIQLRAPARSISNGGLDSSDIERILELQAIALKDLAGDVIEGDVSCFDELKRIRDAQVRKAQNGLP